MKLDDAVDFESPDRQPVDLMFALVVPEAATDEHLQLLAAVVERFNDSETVAALRDTRDPDELYRLFFKGF